jgi:hypothetical protein
MPTVAASSVRSALLLAVSLAVTSTGAAAQDYYLERALFSQAPDVPVCAPLARAWSYTVERYGSLSDCEDKLTIAFTYSGVPPPPAARDWTIGSPRAPCWTNTFLADTTPYFSIGVCKPVPENTTFAEVARGLFDAAGRHRLEVGTRDDGVLVVPADGTSRKVVRMTREGCFNDPAVTSVSLRPLDSCLSWRARLPAASRYAKAARSSMTVYLNLTAMAYYEYTGKDAMGCNPRAEFVKESVGEVTVNPCYSVDELFSDPFPDASSSAPPTPSSSVQAPSPSAEAPPASPSDSPAASPSNPPAASSSNPPAASPLDPPVDPGASPSASPPVVIVIQPSPSVDASSPAPSSLIASSPSASQPSVAASSSTIASASPLPAQNVASPTAAPTGIAPSSSSRPPVEKSAAAVASLRSSAVVWVTVVVAMLFASL